MSTITSFEDACAALSIEAKLPDVSMLPAAYHKQNIAHHKLMVIAEALNEGWKPNWDDSSEYKYWPYFETNPAGVGFSYTYCDDWYTFTYVGSRLCYKSDELAEYAGKQFIDIYNDFLTY